LGVRIPEDLHERLAAIQYYTRKTIQELVTGMLQDGIDAMEAEIHRQRGGDP
jgi:predicted DNA-binding protein